MSETSPDSNGELRGLCPAEVIQRREQCGANELPTPGGHGLLVDILNLLREPMSLLLLVCGGIYAAVGDRQEAFMLLGFVIFIMGLTLIQERKTGRALAALRDLASPRALVIRGGERIRIAGRSGGAGGSGMQRDLAAREQELSDRLRHERSALRMHVMKS